MASGENGDHLSRESTPPEQVPDIFSNEELARHQEQAAAGQTQQQSGPPTFGVLAGPGGPIFPVRSNAERFPGRPPWDYPGYPATRRPGGRPYPREPVLAPPTNIIGAPLGRNLSAVQAADARVGQLERLRQIHLDHYGRTVEQTSLRELERRLDAARNARARLDAINDRDDVNRPLDDTEGYRRWAVAERVGFLEKAIRKSVNEEEKKNMRAAVECYGNGTITASTHFALFYAGHFMEFAPSYAAFTGDRAQRLDRYFERHGPGFLWFEPPLSRDAEFPGGRVIASRATWSQPDDQVNDLGHFFVTMSFRRVRQLAQGFIGNWSGKKEEEKEIVHSDATDFAPSLGIRRVAPPSKQEIDPTAPRHFFSMLLDSGATLPMLYDMDLKILGLDPDTDPPSSRAPISTASDQIMSPLYEMHVTIADTRSCASLVDPANPVWPEGSPHLGGIVLVGFLPDPKEGDQYEGYQGFTVDEKTIQGTNVAEGKALHRLSGILPFKSCYVQCTPGTNTLWLGEDRLDVLGAHRMPGHMRWEAGSAQVFDPAQPRHMWNKLSMFGDGNPETLRMEHKVVDNKGRKVMTVTDTERAGSRSRIDVQVCDVDDADEVQHPPPPKSAEHPQGRRPDGIERLRRFLEERRQPGLQMRRGESRTETNRKRRRLN